jgi:hypothetical protein
MSHFPWKGEVLYMGESIQAEHLPWHYPFVWMGVTIPIVYLVLAGFGLMNREIREDKTHMWILLTGIFPVLLVTLLGSVLYDGWRHLYFVYPVFLWFSILGVRYLEARWPQRKMFIWGIGSLCLSWIGVRMIQHHPYEMVYFNALGGERSTLRARFELDYWGLGFREMLEEILRMDDRDMISVGVSNISGIYAKDILSVEGQKRIRFVGKQDKADYFMSNFRWHPEGYPLPKVFSLVVEGLELGAVYRIRIQEEEESKRGL